MWPELDTPRSRFDHNADHNVSRRADHTGLIQSAAERCHPGLSAARVLACNMQYRRCPKGSTSE